MRARTVAAATLLALSAAGLSGCAALPALPSILGGLGGGTQGEALLRTSVELTRANYRVVQSDVVGESRGFTLLIFLTIDPVSYTEAFAELEANAPLAEAGAWAFANVVHEKSARNFLLFALPKIRVRADVVEFLDEPPADPEGPAPR